MQLVDWRVAEATGVRLVPPGPALELGQATATVEQLRALAEQASGHVAAFTGLDTGETSATIAVVDRPDWIRANVAGFQRLADPLLAKVMERRGVSTSGMLASAGAGIAGVEVGMLLGYLATRVLGQFELLGPPPPASESDPAAGTGRLSLVAPNIVVAERALGVDPRDFRLWVCLHEVTHRTQFAAAPWLYGYVSQLLGDYLDAADLEPAALMGRLRSALRGVIEVLLGRSECSLVELMQTDEQQVILDRVTGLMSLLEGHADVVMDGVGPTVIGSVEAIRSRFEQRRRDVNPVERAFRRLLGVEAKMRQYAEGAAFVRAVLDKVGMAGLNQVWTGPDALPTGIEIRNPAAWLDRINPPAITA